MVTSGVAVLFLVAAYLLGTLPSALLVARRRGHDPLHEGSGNPGATNVLRIAGRRAGSLVLALDAGKGALAALAGLVVDGRALGTAAWVAAVLGHVLPLTRARRGGKGVATAAGGAAVLHPITAAGLVLLFALVAAVSRRASVASLSIAAALPLGVALSGRAGWETAVAGGVSAVVVLRHAGNVRRLVRGEEPALLPADRVPPERPAAGYGRSDPTPSSGAEP